MARVLRWGPGYNGEDDPLNLLRDVIDAEEIKLDRYGHVIMNKYKFLIHFNTTYVYVKVIDGATAITVLNAMFLGCLMEAFN